VAILTTESVLICWFVQYPVYFAYEDENVQSILHEVSANDAAGRPATATTGGYAQF
jgi:hypothetical protein